MYLTLDDIVSAARAELTFLYHYTTRTQDTAPRYLYYKESGKDGVHGAIIFAKDAPANPDFKLAASQAIRFDATIDQNLNMLTPVFRRLPVLTVDDKYLTK